MSASSWRGRHALLCLPLLLAFAAPAAAQQVTNSAVLHRDTIVEGQTRAFQITNIPTRSQYYLHASVGGAFTAEAGDVTITTNNLRGQAQAVTPDANGPRAYPDAVYRHIRFEVTANGDSDGTDDETFGVRLCTTADCTGGTVLGEWTVTITEPEAESDVSGATGATVTIVGGGSRLTMMESSANDDTRDKQARLRITLASSPTADIVLVARTLATVRTGSDGEGNSTTRWTARGVGPNSPDAPTHDVEVARWSSGATGADLTKEAVFFANDNIADAPGGAHTGNFLFRLLILNERYTDGSTGNGTAYSGVTIPDVPFSVIDDDPTRIRLLPTSPADNEATEGGTDKATVLVRLERALAAGEEATALLTFSGASLGANFTLAAASGQTGATYADSDDGAQGLVTLAGAGVREAVIEVTALTDSDADSQTLQIGMPPFDNPGRGNHHRSNLAGGVCAAHGCPNRPQGDPGQRFQSVTLAEASPGLTIIDEGDGRVGENGGQYSYTVRLNTAPAANVTVAVSSGDTSKATVRAGASLTFTPSGPGIWSTPQTVTVQGANNNADAADAAVTITHAVTGTGDYASIADATHELTVVDDDATEVTMSGAGVRASPSDTSISQVMLEGDASRVDRSLTVTLSRPLAAGEYARIPLILQAMGHSTADGDCDTSGNDVPDDALEHCVIVEGLRGPRISANVAWPPHHNDFVMTATGTGVSLEGVNRYTPNYRGYRILEFRGAGAQTATFALHARDGFDDGEGFDERFSIGFIEPKDIEKLWTGNFDGGIVVETSSDTAWFGIEDKDPPSDVIAVPADWSLLPSGLSPGDRFRLIYVTSQTTSATSRDLASYDAFVRAEITGDHLNSGGVTALLDHAGSFRVIGEVGQPLAKAHIAARDHARFNPSNPDHPNVPIYWMGGSKVADDKQDFTNENWDDEANPRTADGAAATINAGGYWTGTSGLGYWTGGGCSYDTRNGPGTNYFTGGYPALGHLPSASRDGRPARVSSVGYLNDGTHNDRNPLGPRTGLNESTTRTQFIGVCYPNEANSGMKPMYALSGVFVVEDEPGVTIENASAAEGSAVTFTVTLPDGYANSAGVSVPYTLADGRGVSGDPAYIIATSADYTNTAGSVTIPANSASATFTVATADDSAYESDHYFTVTLGTPTSTGTPPPLGLSKTAIGTITDAADRPAIEFSPATASATEGTDTEVSVTVTKTGATEVASSVYWTTADGTAAHPGDYTADAGHLEFAPGDTSRTIAIDLTDDADREGAETFKVQLSQPSEATLGSASEATVTLNDDDGGAPPPTVPTVQFKDAAKVIYEARPFEFPYVGEAEIESSSAVAADTVVRFTIGGTATEGSDYVIIESTSARSATIKAGETESSASVRMLTDVFHEADETVILTLIDGEDYDLGEQTVMTVTIRDLPDVQFAEAVSTGLEGTDLTVNLEATHDFAEAADVTFRIVGTATPSTDYTTPASPVRFGVGERTATITIPIVLDTVSESGETIVLDLTDDTLADNRYELGAQTTHTVTLEDNLALLPLTVKFTASASSVQESAGTATVMVEASRPASEDTDVAFTVTHPAQNAATAGTDYTTPTSPVTIASGQTTAMISIPILDDNDDCTEQDGIYSCPDDGEKFILTLTDGADYDLADTNTRHTVTIFEDPVKNKEGEALAGGLATINLTRPRLHLAEGGPSVRYGISLTRNPKANVDVYVTSPDIGLFTVAGSDGVRYQQIALRFTRRNWETPQFVTVQAVQDDDKDSEQNLLIDHAIRGTQADSANFEFGSPYFSHNRGGTGDNSSDDIGVALPDLPVYIADDDASSGDGGLTLEYLDADAARPIVIEEGKATTLRLRWSRALTTGETAAARLTIVGGAHGEGKDYQVTTDTPNVTVEALPVSAAKTEFIVTWAKAATNAAAAIKIKSRNDGKRATGERDLSVELLDAFSADGSAGQDDTPSGVRLKNGPQEERIHVLSRDRLVVQQTTPDGLVFNGLETTGDDAELTTDDAWAEIDEDGSATHKVKLSLSRPPTNTEDVVVTVSTSDNEKLSVAGSDDGDGVADTVTWVSSGSGTRYDDSVTVEFTAEEDDDSDSEAVFVYFTMTSGYGNAHPPGTLVRAFRVDITDDDAGVAVTPTSLTLTEGAKRGQPIPGSDPARRTHQIAVRLNTDPGDSGIVTLTPSVYDVKNTNALSTKVDRDKRQLRFTGGDSGNWNEYQLIGFSAKADSDSDNDEFFLRWNVTGYTGVTSADIPAVTIKVTDNDPAVRISESEIDMVEGASAGSGGARTYDVVLNAPPAAGEVVIVTPTSSDPGAVSFDAGSALATPGRPPRFGVSNWDRPRRVTIYAAADGDEDDETATVTHSVSGGNNYGSVAAPAVTVNVLDKDGPEGIVLSADSVRVEEGGHPVSFTVRLAGRPSGPVSLNVTGAGSAVSADADLSTDGAQTTLAFTQQDWHRPQTVWLSAGDESDTMDSDDEFVTLMVGGVGASYVALPVTVTVLDDEFTGPTFTVTGSGTLTEGTVGSALFTVSADISPTGALPVTLNISETADFVLAGDEGDQTLGFSSLLAIINHSVPIDDDSVAEDDGSITATLKPGSGYRVGTPSSATINVVDDPNDGGASAVTVDLSGATFSAWEGESVSVPVVLSSVRSATTTIELEQSGPATATSGADFTAGPWSVTVPAGQTTASASIALTDDTALEMDEVFSIRIRQSSLPAGVAAGTATTARVTIMDNEYTLCFDNLSFPVNEHAGGVDLPLTMSRAVQNDVTVYFDYTDVTAMAGTDYTAVYASSSDTVTIAAGDRNLAMTVPVHPDLASTSNKNFTVTARPAALPDGQTACSVTVIITSSGLVIAESGAGTTVNEDGSDNDTYTIALENRPDSDVTVTVTVTAGAQVNKAGGTAGTSQTLTFSPSGTNVWSAAQTITVTGVDDNIVNDGGGRTVRIAHATSSSDADYAIANAGGVSVTVTDDDGGATDGVTVTPTSLALTELGSPNAVEKTYTVALDTDPGAAVTVTVANGDNTAVEVDTDAGTTGNQNTLTFTHGNSGNWNTAQTVTVRALNDADGANESFNLTMGATAAGNTAPYHGIAVDPVAVTTTDAGHGAVVSKSSLSVAANDGTDTYTVALKSRPSGNVVITATSGATANAEVDTDAGMAGNQDMLTFTNSDWNMPQPVTVTGKGQGSTSITHRVSTTADTANYPTSTTTPAVSVTVTADTRPEVTVAPDGATVSEGEDDPTTGGTQQRPVRFTISGPNTLGSTLSVSYALSQTGSFVASLPASGSTNLSAAPLNASQSSPYAVTDDSTDEPNGTLTATLSAGTGYRIGSPGTATVTLVDNDPTTVTLAGGGTVTEDGANSVDVTVTLGRNLVAGETVTVPLTVSGTGVAAGDYTIAPAPGSNLNTGVALDTNSPHSAAQPAVAFTGHGTDTVRVATLRVTAVQDTTDEGLSETLAVGFGSGNRAVVSNLDLADPSTTGTGGTTASGSATVTITDDDTAAAAPEVSMALQTGETSNRNADNQLELVESGGADGAVFNLSADGVLAATLTVCLNVAEAGGDLLAASAEGIRTATLTSGGNVNGAGIYQLTWTGDTDDERDSVVTATLVAPGTAGCSAAAGSYTVASAMASDAVRIEDDDATTVELTSADRDMAEGDASDTATLTFALGRRLHAGEAVVVPFTLATTTGARLPGNAMADFSVTAAGMGVTVANAATATPSLTFTGHGTNVVRTATVTLTPVANRDDGDRDHEALTATLAPDSALGSTSGTGTTVGGGAMRHGTNFAANLRLVDDESGAAPELAFGSAAHSVAEDAGTVSVTVDAAPAPGAALTVKLSSRSGTAGLADYAKPPATFEFPANQASHTVSVTVRDDGLHEDDETFTLTLVAASDSSYTVGSPATTEVTITSDDPRPPPTVSVHPKDAVGTEGAANSISVELRLSRALESGETLTVPYSLDLNAAATASQTGVTIENPVSGNPSTGTLKIAGPNAPQDIALQLSPAANTVDRTVSGSRAADFRLTGVTGVAGASLSAVAGAKVFVNDANIERSTSIQVSGGSRLGRREFEEGGEVWVLLDGRAGRKRDGGGLRTHDGHNVVIGVQHLTTGFDDLGAAYAGHDALVGHLGREGDTDYYNVGVLGYGPSAQVRIPILSDGAGEGDERFRVFIAETPGTLSPRNVFPDNGARTSYMGVRGAYNSLDRAPGVDFTIRGQPGGGQRDAQPPAGPPAPTQAVSNVQLTAVDANSVRVAWDAVERATGYEVAWDALDGDGQPIASGLSIGVTGTTATIEHNAPGAASLRVTVAPEYVDGNGDTQTLAGLAATATIDLGSTGNGDSVGDGGTGGEDSQTPNPTPASSCVGDGQWDTVAGYYGSNANKSPNYGANWYRVLIAYRLEDADRALPAWTGATERPTAAFTVGEAEDEEAVWSGWTPVRKALECLRDANLVSRSFVPLVPAASNPAREGVVRVVNRSGQPGVVRIQATDDAGWRPEPLTLLLDAGGSVELTSRDLESGNAAKGLSGGIGTGTGDWRLDVSSGLDLGVRPFVRAADGASAAMHGLAEATDGVHAVWTFNPAGELAQSSLLRVMNLGAEPATARITGIDDAGLPGGTVTLEVPARASVQLGAADLEGGGPGLSGRLGDGRGRWRLRVASEGELAVMNLALSPFGHLTNLSDGGFPALRSGRAHPVPHVPPASDGLGRLGLVRVINQSARGGEVHVLAHDAAGRRHGPLTLRLGPGGAAHFDSWDLELGGEAGSGLSGGTGPGVGAWRLEVTSGLDIVVRSYIATPAGALKTAREFVAGPGPLRDEVTFAEDR